MDDVPDFELLRLFAALHRERHLTRAAAMTGRSQPAMSRALARMREVFGDVLFVRTPTGMLPTARADALAPEVRRVLEQANALVRPLAFDSRALRRTFVVFMADMVELHVMPNLGRILADEAPGVDVVVRGGRDDPTPLFEAGLLDLFVAPKDNVPPGLMAKHLFDDSLLCVARHDHPKLRRGLTLERYVSLPHVQIAPGGRPGGPVDDALAARGLARRVVVRTPTFASAPMIVARSDFLLTAPSKMLEDVAGWLGLRTYALPLPVPGFRIYQAWHRRLHDDPAHRFFREAFARAAASLTRKRATTASERSASAK